MNKVTNKFSLFLLLISFSIIHSCTTLPTKPNIPYSGFHFLLDEMSKKNNLLSIEIRKIPEFTDGISPEEESALKKLIKLYNEDPDVFDFAFDEMYQEGLPDIRRYCTPLQALFWLMQDNKFDMAKESIEKYELKWLLFYAWAAKKKERWGNFNAVVERLNSPRILDYYQVTNFAYRSGRGRRPGYSKRIFRTKVGDCRDYTAFSVDCLVGAGYQARAIKVVSPSGGNYHVVCEFKENGENYIIDNSCIGPCGGGGIQKKAVYVGLLPQIGFGYGN